MYRYQKLIACLITIACGIGSANAALWNDKKDSFGEYVYEDFQILVNSVGALPVYQLQAVDGRVRRVALYQYNGRLSEELSFQTKSMIENSIIEKLLQTRRFEVVECVVCRKSTVLISEGKVSMAHPLDTNQTLQQMGVDMAIDAFLLWSATSSDGHRQLSARLVLAGTGEVVWSNQRSMLATKDSGGFTKSDIYVSRWGYSASRKILDDADPLDADGNELPENISMSGLLAGGYRYREVGGIGESLTYSLGVGTFLNMSGIDDSFSVVGFNAEGRVYVDMIKLGFKFFDVINLRDIYFGVGQAIFADNSAFTFSGGVEYPFARHGYINLGFMYMPSVEIDWGLEPEEYERTSDFGGFTSEITLGFTF